MAFNRQALARAFPSNMLIGATGGYVPPGMPGHVSGCALPFDVPQARQLLAEAGYAGGKGLPEFTVAATPNSVTRAQFLQNSWREHLGLVTHLKGGDFESWYDAKEQHAPAIALGAWIADYPDPDTFLRVDVQFTIPEWRDDAYLGLLDRASRTGDQQARLALYQEAERILAREAVLVPMAYKNQHFLLKPWVKRYPTSAVKHVGFWKDVVVEGEEMTSSRKSGHE